MKNKHMTYLAVKNGDTYLLSTSDSDQTFEHSHDNIENIISNVIGVYTGVIIPMDGMPALDAKEDNIPLITAVENEKGVIDIALFINEGNQVRELSGRATEAMLGHNITALHVGDYMLMSSIDKLTEIEKTDQNSRMIKENIEESLEAVKALYSNSDLEFIKGAKDWLFEAHLVESDFYSRKHDYLIDGIIKGLDSSINLRGIDAYRSLPLGIIPHDEAYISELNHRKINLIKLLSLKHAINEEINEELETMRVITKERGHYAN